MSYPNGRFSPPNTPLNGTATYGTQPWRRETVQAFFEGFAWSGERLGSGLSQPPGAEQKFASLMTLAVGDFFPAIPWEGRPAIGVPIAPLATQVPAVATEDDLTLDGFSDLFG